MTDPRDFVCEHAVCPLLCHAKRGIPASSVLLLRAHGQPPLACPTVPFPVGYGYRLDLNFVCTTVRAEDSCTMAVPELEPLPCVRGHVPRVWCHLKPGGTYNTTQMCSQPRHKRLPVGLSKLVSDEESDQRCSDTVLCHCGEHGPLDPVRGQLGVSSS